MRPLHVKPPDLPHPLFSCFLFRDQESTKLVNQKPSDGNHPDQQPLSHQVVKAATALTAGGSLLVLSAVILAGTVIALAIATPLLVIFSPVLVPAVIAVGLLVTGFLTSGGLGISAVTVLSWLYRYMTGKHPLGADQLDQARHTLASKAREMKDRAEQFGHQHVTTTTQ